MLKIICFSAASSFILISCGSKTPEDYAKEYCQCMQQYQDNPVRCKDILEDAKSEFGEDNEDAKKEFKNAYKSCMEE
ncbi:MAG: hypothetical protein R2799_08885 [Crocinitomicaceae bacterium]